MADEHFEVTEEGKVVSLEPGSDSRAWSALADLHDDLDRFKKHSSVRMDRLETKVAGGVTDQLIDNRTIGMLIAITVIPIALQVIGMLLARNAAKG
jgi:hypothetical protein